MLAGNEQRWVRELAVIQTSLSNGFLKKSVFE